MSRARPASTARRYSGRTQEQIPARTTGCGAAFFDYDNDGWPGYLSRNGTRFEAKYAKGAAPTNRLYKNIATVHSRM